MTTIPYPRKRMTLLRSVAQGVVRETRRHLLSGPLDEWEDDNNHWTGIPRDVFISAQRAVEDAMEAWIVRRKDVIP